MEINANMSAGGVKGPTPIKRPVAGEQPVTDDVSLNKSAALEGALKSTSDTRSEAVEKARQLIGDANYPPQETIKKISQLLAIKLQSENE